MSNLEQKAAELRRTMARAQSELAELEKQIKAGGDSPVFGPADGQLWWNVSGSCSPNGPEAVRDFSHTLAGFRTADAATAHGRAWLVTMELRACEGVVKAIPGCGQYVVRTPIYDPNSLIADESRRVDVKMDTMLLTLLRQEGSVPSRLRQGWCRSNLESHANLGLGGLMGERPAAHYAKHLRKKGS